MGLAKYGPRDITCQTVVKHTIGHPKTLLTELINKWINYNPWGLVEPRTAVSEFTLGLQLNSHSAPMTPTPPPNLCSSEPHPPAVASSKQLLMDCMQSALPLTLALHISKEQGGNPIFKQIFSIIKVVGIEIHNISDIRAQLGLNRLELEFSIRCQSFQHADELLPLGYVKRPVMCKICLPMKNTFHY